jgi:chemotaxis protein methyltransferase CheR
MGLTAQDFEFVRTFIRERSAMVLDEGKSYIVESRLLGVVRSEELESVAALVAELRRQPKGRMAEVVVDAMTNNETLFFRDPPVFDALRDDVIPDLVRRRGSERALRIWCAASSSGQEPYSLAMLLRESFPELRGWTLDFVATDISPTMLERCRVGRYSKLEVGRGLPEPLLRRYFSESGSEFEIDPAVRGMVTFRRMNLSEPWPSLGRLDLVLLRNVLIYFDVATKREILKRVGRTLADDGYLLLGGGETTVMLDDSYERVQFGRAAFYRPRREWAKATGT